MKTVRGLLAAAVIAAAEAAQLRSRRASALAPPLGGANATAGDAVLIQHQGASIVGGASITDGAVQGQGAMDATVDAMVTALLREEQGTTIRSIIKTVHDKMSFSDALQRLGDKLPQDLAALVHVENVADKRHIAGRRANVSEASLQAARRVFNGMLRASQAELDDVALGCQEFRNANRKTFDQVVTDLARYGSAVAEADEKIAESLQCQLDQDMAFKSTSDTMQQEENVYLKAKAESEAQLSQKGNDLAVFSFLMDITRCAEGPHGNGSMLVQVAANRTQPVRLCSTEEGPELDFSDGRLQAKVESMMTPAARLALREALGVAVVGDSPAQVIDHAMLQKGAMKMGRPVEKDCAALYENADFSGWVAAFGEGSYDLAALVARGGKDNEASALEVDPDCTVTLYENANFTGRSATFVGGSYNSRGMIATGIADDQVSSAKVQRSVSGDLPSLTLEPTPVKQGPNEEQQWKKCTDGTANCGVLHDTMSLQWGKFKDILAELQAGMQQSQDVWDKLKTNLNSQLKVITQQKGGCQAKFDRATGAKNTLTEERMQKDDQHRSLTVAYEAKMAVCKARIEELLYTDVCAVRMVRNQVMRNSSISPAAAIIDCEVGDWAAAPCSVECDNSCPHLVGGHVDPYACGGWKMLKRTPIVQANEYGVVCPALVRRAKCGQFKCPVDCVLSRWSGWSKCTKECEGGSQQMTRSVIAKPKHGGAACAATVETRACNTQSCDHDCELNDWAAWSHCSMSCNPGGMPGFQYRRRSVLVPIRGSGKCPGSTHADRYHQRTCNEQPCFGDEICIAKQDLIILLDASGSLKAEGFEVLRDFAGNLTTRYKSRYFGADTVHVGIVLFGNGVRESDDTTAPAINVISLTANLTAVARMIRVTTWQRGFTNLAQAFVLADTMFQQGGRTDAQSAVLVLSDGQYAFSFETQKAVRLLKEKNTLIFMAPIAARPGPWQVKMREWASQPWQTNYQLIPGVQTLKHNMNVFTSALVAKFCSDAVSPIGMRAKEEDWGYMLIREGGFADDKCAKYHDLGYVSTVADCKNKAQQQLGMMAFAVGVEQGKESKHCFSESIQVTQENWTAWQANRADIPCPGGAWLDNPMYDVYAILPTSRSR